MSSPPRQSRSLETTHDDGGLRVPLWIAPGRTAPIVRANRFDQIPPASFRTNALAARKPTGDCALRNRVSGGEARSVDEVLAKAGLFQGIAEQAAGEVAASLDYGDCGRDRRNSASVSWATRCTSCWPAR